MGQVHVDGLSSAWLKETFLSGFAFPFRLLLLLSLSVVDQLDAPCLILHKSGEAQSDIGSGFPSPIVLPLECYCVCKQSSVNTLVCTPHWPLWALKTLIYNCR